MLEQGQLESWDRESFFHPNTHLGQFVRKEAPHVVMTGGGETIKHYTFVHLGPPIPHPNLMEGAPAK